MKSKESKNSTEWIEATDTGLWTVLGPYIITQNEERKYLCRCECGTERYVLERSLRYGGSKSCGCLKFRHATEKREHKLEGKTFGELTVLGKAEKKKRNGGTWWICRCSCGKIMEVSGTLLVTGRKSHCGCKAEPKNYYSVDITGQRFHRLTAKYPLKQRDQKGGMIWHCECSCGNEVDVPYASLVYSDIKSCGCQKKEHDQLLPSLITRVDGTSLDMIKSKKIPCDNTTGVKGVYFNRGKWMAKIVFQQKQYHLGQYEHIEDAAKARRDAEELLFDGTAAYYERWESMAQRDPEWAENNPVQIFVSKKSTNELSVTFLPVIS